MKLSKLLTAVVPMALAVFVAPVSQADQYEYLDALDGAGIAYSSPSEMIDFGKWICTTIRNAPDGYVIPADREPTPTYYLLRNAIRSQGYNYGFVHWKIVTSATYNMCPDVADKYHNMSGIGPPPKPPGRS